MIKKLLDDFIYFATERAIYKYYILDWIFHPIINISWTWHRICRVFAYIPYVWQCHDFDWACTYPLLLYRIQRLRKSIDANQWHLAYEKDVKQMKIAEKLIERIMDDMYGIDYDQSLYNADRDELFALLRKHSDGWWD